MNVNSYLINKYISIVFFYLNRTIVGDYVVANLNKFIIIIQRIYGDAVRVYCLVLDLQ